MSYFSFPQGKIDLVTRESRIQEQIRLVRHAYAEQAWDSSEFVLTEECFTLNMSQGISSVSFEIFVRPIPTDGLHFSLHVCRRGGNAAVGEVLAYKKNGIAVAEAALKYNHPDTQRRIFGVISTLIDEANSLGSSAGFHYAVNQYHAFS